MKKFLFYFAVTGWAISLTTHLLSLAGVDVMDKAPYLWLLPIGIFVVWLPTIFFLRRNEDLKAYKKANLLNSFNPFGFFAVIFKDTPAWLKIAAIVGFFYAIVNFSLLMFIDPSGGQAVIHNGQFVLQDHGQILKNLSEQEYHHYKAIEARAFTGHFIAFYGIAMAVLYPLKNRSQELPDY